MEVPAAVGWMFEPSGPPPVTSLVSNINDLLKGCLPEQRVSVLKEYLKIHRDSIRNETLYIVTSRRKGPRRAHRNLFLPCSVGGMGVIPPQGWRFKITNDDRLLAQTIERRYAAPISVSYGIPLRGYPMGELATHLRAPWEMTESVKQIELVNFDGLRPRREQIHLGLTPCVSCPSIISLS